LWGAGDGWASSIAPGPAHVRAPAPGGGDGSRGSIAPGPAHVRAPAPVAGAGGSVADALWQERNHPDLLRLLARFALQFRPPTGFLRDFVVEHSGERRGQLDIKHGGLIPIVDLARWAGMAASAASGSTVERLRAAEAAGTLESTDART